VGELTKKDMQEVMREALDERSAIGGEQHHNDHEFVQLLMEREERRMARIEKFKLSFIGGFALSLLGGLVWLGRWLISHVHWGV